VGVAGGIGRASGGFYWSDGTPVVAEMWHKSASRNEPNTAKPGQQACVYLWYDHTNLGDWKCEDNEANVLCQLPPKYLSCFA
jgi:hypothetical protein